MEIGLHCLQETGLDFLPFSCERCKKTFCQDHKLPDQHQCPVIKEVEADSHATPKTRNESVYPMCSVPGCGSAGIVEMKCEMCQKWVCLSHRHATEHECTAVKSLTASKPVHKSVTPQKSKASGKPTGGGARVKKGGNRRQVKQSSLSIKVALMRLKQRAEGPSSIPDSERAYFEIILPKEYGSITKPVFISSVWTVGKTIDHLSQKYKLVNKNDQFSAQKLCLYVRHDDEEHLSMRLTIENLLETVSSGSTLCLEYKS